MLKQEEIKALVELLDDPDDQVYEHIRNKLTDFGLEVIPYLESAWEHFSYGVLFQNRIEDIIHQIQFDHVKDLLNRWNTGLHQDLLEGMLIIQRYQYPDFDQTKIKNFLSLLTRDVWLELNDSLTALEKVKVINHILFSIHHFSGNTTNYHAPQNSYLGDVLETKRGNPISLCIIYLLIAKSLDLPIYGINLPRHFIIAYQDPFAQESSIKTLFYINPFNKGSILNKRDIDYFLKQLQIDPTTAYYEPCDHRAIIKRVLYNLYYSYEKLAHQEKCEELKQLLEIMGDFGLSKAD